MNIHGIEPDSMLNGDGLRVVLWVSGCNHHCKNCQNPETWCPTSGREFMMDDFFDLRQELAKPHVSGLTLSGGDPLFPDNREAIFKLVYYIKQFYPTKTIWLYTGYLWEEVRDEPILEYIDVLVDGEFKEELADINYHWAGSTNQRVIDVQRSLKEHKVVLHE